MDTLQNAFGEAINRVVDGEVARVICKRLDAEGVTLTRKERGRMARELRLGGGEPVIIRRWWDWRPSRKVVIELTPEDAAEIEAVLQTLTDDTSTLLVEAAEAVVPGCLARLKRTWPRYKRRDAQAIRGFRQRLERRWLEPLDRLEMMIVIAREAGSSLSERTSRIEFDRPQVLDVVTRLHARTCQVAEECLLLLRHGFADGAMARWRTIHELAVIAMFLARADEDTAERYRAYDVIETLDSASDYIAHQDALGVEPVERTYIASLNRQCNDLCLRYGDAFRKPYGWAAHKFGNSKMSFEKLANSLSVGHWLPYVNMAHQRIHAGPKGVFYQLGQLGEERALIAGPSNYGLADPGAHTCVALLQATVALLSLSANVDSVVTMRVLESLCDEAEQTFLTVQRQIEADEKALRGDESGESPKA